MTGQSVQVVVENSKKMLPVAIFQNVFNVPLLIEKNDW